MKYLLVVGDGMADFPLDELGGKTPLAAARTPAMDRVVAEGQCGLVQPIPKGFPASHDVGVLSLLGYNPREVEAGIATWRALDYGIQLEPGEIGLLCDFVTIRAGEMADTTAGRLDERSARELLDTLNRHLGEPYLRFERGAGHAHVLVVEEAKLTANSGAPLRCMAPHDIQGAAVTPFLPRGSGADGLVRLMERAAELLERHPVNAARTSKGSPAANAIWLWGPGRAATLKPFHDRHGRDGAVIASHPAVRAVARLAELEVVPIDAPGSYLDINYEAMVEASIDALERVDFVMLYAEAPDEVSLEGRPDLKVKTIEDLDQRAVAPLVAHLHERHECRLLVTADHVTSVKTRAHDSGAVPFALEGAAVEPDPRAHFSEAEAAQSDIVVSDGYMLVQQMINPEPIGFTTDG